VLGEKLVESPLPPGFADHNEVEISKSAKAGDVAESNQRVGLSILWPRTETPE
jgi:hypothetical protein